MNYLATFSLGAFLLACAIPVDARGSANVTISKGQAVSQRTATRWVANYRG